MASMLPRPEERVCLFCGRAYMAKKRASRYCSTSCANRGRGPVGPVPEATCVQCSVVFRRRTHGGGDRRLFCSRECSFAFLAARRVARQAALVAARAERLARRKAAQTERRAAWPDCEACGSKFKPGWYPSRFCSRQCRNGSGYVRRKPLVVSTCVDCGASVEAVRQRQRCDKCQKRAIRRARGSDTHEARARRRGLPRDYSITADRLFTRDGWRCQICGIKTPKRLKGLQQPQSPTIDHIVPISQGGGHVWENVQTACHACNMRKGAKVLGQLRLVG